MFKQPSCAVSNCCSPPLLTIFDFHFQPFGRSLRRTWCFVISNKNKVLNLVPGLSSSLHWEHRNLELGDSLGWLLWRLRGKYCMFMTLVLLQLLRRWRSAPAETIDLLEVYQTRVGSQISHLNNSLVVVRRSSAGWRPGRYEWSIVIIKTFNGRPFSSKATARIRVQIDNPIATDPPVLHGNPGRV